MRSAWLEQLAGDVRFSLRALSRARGYTLTVLFTLILGVSVTAGIYELTSWIVFRSSPYPHPEQLVAVGYKDRSGQSSFYRAGFFFRLYQEQIPIFSDLGAVQHPTVNMVIDGQPVAERVANISERVFPLFDIRPSLGRVFLPAEFKAGGDAEVVIGYRFWKKYYELNPEVLGKQLLIDRTPCTIVGVLGKATSLPNVFYGDVYRPMVVHEDLTNVFDQMGVIVGRLKPGVSKQQADAAFTTLKLPALPKWASTYFDGQITTVTNIRQLFKQDAWAVMLAAGIFLYAIACLNATNLMLNRLLDRRRELSIRFAVGGSRAQVIRVVAVEGLLLTLTSCLVVTFVARWIFPPVYAVLQRRETANFERSYWDWHTFALIFGLGIFACIAATTLPTLRLLRADVSSGLKDGGASLGESRGTGRLRNAFIVLQAAFAVTLLTGTGLMVRSFAELRRIDLGFDPVGKVKVLVIAPQGYQLKPQAYLEIYDRIKARVALLPGVRAVSYGQDALLAGDWDGAQLKMGDGTTRPISNRIVAADYQQTVGLVMVMGRWLSGKQGVYETVINETLAKTRFADRDPLGQTLETVNGMPHQVVGVVKDIRQDMRSTPGMMCFWPSWEFPNNVQSLVIRMDQDPKKEFSSLVRKAVYEVDPNMVVSWLTSLDEEVVDVMWSENFAYAALKGLAGVALGLTVVGIFSVIAYTVDSRTTEFGVRLALGATPGELNWLVLRRGMAAAGLGIAIGLAAAAALTRFMQSLLFETAPFDPVVYLAVAGVLLVSSVVACWVPARRAARTDVMRLLKSD